MNHSKLVNKHTLGDGGCDDPFPLSASFLLLPFPFAASVLFDKYKKNIRELAEPELGFGEPERAILADPDEELLELCVGPVGARLGQ